MNEFYVAGFCVGLFLVLFVFLLIKAFNKNKTKCEYDERQILARNSAYKTSFFTLIGYMALVAMLDSMGLKWAELGIQMILGILLSVGVFVTICIFKDAYFSYNEKSMKSYFLLCIAIMVLNLVAFIMNTVLDGESILTDGLLNYNATNLFVSILFAIFLIMVIIKGMISKRTVEDEE